MNFLTDERGKNIKPQNPLPVDNVRSASEREAISAESVTLVTGAAGFTGSVALDKAPIANLIGDGVGSFWRRPDNLLLSTENNKLVVTAVTETATAATVTVSSADYDLEELLEIPSGTAKAIIEITDPSGGTLYGYIGGIAETGTSYVINVYNTAAFGAQSWVGTLSGFTFATGTRVEIYRNSSSFAWVTGTILTQEVDFGDGKDVVKFLDSLSNGQYGIDYGRGTVHYKKATTGTSDTCNYSVLKTYSTATISGAVDTEFPAAAALADAKANPTTTSVEAHMSGFNGTTWDRLRSGVTALTATLTGFLNTLPWAVYNASPTVRTEGQGGPLQATATGNLKVEDQGGGGSIGGGNNSYTTDDDFTATVTDGTTNIVLSVDSVGGKAITDANFANAILKVEDISLTPPEWKTIKLDKFTWTAGTKTLAVANCTGAFTFGTGDVVSLSITGPLKMNDASADAQKSVEQSPIYTRYSGDTLAALTNITANTTGYLYVSMDGYKYLSLQCATSDATPTDTLTLTIEETNQDDGTADSSCDYDDTTLARFGVASWVDTDVIINFDTPVTSKYVRLKYVTSNTGGNDCDVVVYARRSY